MPPPILIAAGLRVASPEDLPSALQAYFRPAEGTAVVFVAIPVTKRSKRSPAGKERYVLVTQHHVLLLTAGAEVKRWLTIRSLRRVVASGSGELCLQQQGGGAHAHDLLFATHSSADCVAAVRALVLLYRDAHNGAQEVQVLSSPGAFTEAVVGSFSCQKRPEDRDAPQPLPPRLMVWSQQEWRKKGVSISAADAKAIERGDAALEEDRQLRSPQSPYLAAAREAVVVQRAVEAAWRQARHVEAQLDDARQRNDVATAQLNERLQAERLGAIADARAQDEVTAANQKEINEYRRMVGECDDRVAALRQEFHDAEHAHIQRMSELEGTLAGLATTQLAAQAEQEKVQDKPLLDELLAQEEALNERIRRAEAQLARIAPEVDIRNARDAIAALVEENKRLEETVLERMEALRVIKHKADLSDAVLKTELRRERRAEKQTHRLQNGTRELLRVTAEAEQHAARLAGVATDLKRRGERIAVEQSIIDSTSPRRLK
jgi:hypothetical protein